VVTTYSGYRNFAGIQFPARIVQTQGGHPTLDLTVSAVQTNGFVDITLPDQVRNPTAPAAVTATSQKVADGLFWIIGGSPHSLPADMGDHVVVIEGPQNEARSEAVLAEVKKVIPNKPIRFVVNTHVHFDHSGGLRTFVDEGATVVTHQANVAYYEKAWAAPRNLVGDRLAKSGKKAVFQSVTDRSELKGTNNRHLVARAARQPAQRADSGGVAAVRKGAVPVRHDQSSGAERTGPTANADDHELRGEPDAAEDRAGADRWWTWRTHRDARGSERSHRQSRYELVCEGVNPQFP